MPSIPIPTTSIRRRALAIALLSGLAACARSPVLRYDLGGLLGFDPCAAPVAVACPGPPPPTLAYDPAALRWLPKVARATTVRLLVSLRRQRLYAYREDVLVASSPVSSGKPGHATPTGLFRVLGKQVFHRSNRYSNAPMPYMQRLTMSGVALHAGHLPGYPASHGCIRLPAAFARRLYALTSVGTPVLITRGTVAGSDSSRRGRAHI